LESVLDCLFYFFKPYRLQSTSHRVSHNTTE